MSRGAPFLHLMREISTIFILCPHLCMQEHIEGAPSNGRQSFSPKKSSILMVEVKNIFTITLVCNTFHHWQDRSFVLPERNPFPPARLGKHELNYILVALQSLIANLLLLLKFFLCSAQWMLASCFSALPFSVCMSKTEAWQSTLV